MREYLAKILEDQKESIEAEYRLAVELFEKSEPGTSERLAPMGIMEDCDMELRKIAACLGWLRYSQ